MQPSDVLPLLNNVRQRGPSRWSGECPAHPDRSPSLSITGGDKGILLRCWAGCDLEMICRALSIRQRDLFYDALQTDPQKQRAAAQQRAFQRKQRAQEALKRGRLMDACREAEWFIHSRQGIDSSAWSDERLDRELNLLADAYRVLEADPYAY